jgi:hypothetical protein
MAASKLSKLADELDGMDDEPTGEVHVHLPPGTQLEADATGRLKAISAPDDDRPTPTDPPRKVESDAPPPSKVSPLAIAWLLVRKFPPWGAVIVALAAIAAYVLLRR